MKPVEFSDRRSDATNAKAAMLENFRLAQAKAAEGQQARLAERREIAAAREERQAAREQLKRAEEQLALDAAAAAAAEKAREEAEKAASEEGLKDAHARRIALVFSDEAARKALRDQRYAKRKGAAVRG